MVKALITALAKAQKDVKPVHKDAENKFDRYMYASSESMIEEANVILSRHGLGFMRLNQAIRTEGTDKVLAAKYLVIHESGESLELTSEWPICVIAKRTLDKAVAASDTTSFAYALRDLLKIPRVDHEVDGDDEPPRPPQQDAKPEPVNRLPEQKEPPKPSVNGSHQTPSVDYAQLVRQQGMSFEAKLTGLTNEALGDTPDKLLASESVAWDKHPPEVRSALEKSFRLHWIQAKAKWLKAPEDFAELRRDAALLFDGLPEKHHARRDQLYALINEHEKHAKEQARLTAPAKEEWR